MQLIAPPTPARCSTFIEASQERRRLYQKPGGEGPQGATHVALAAARQGQSQRHSEALEYNRNSLVCAGGV